MSEWRAANPGKSEQGLYQSGGRVWTQKTEMDIVVVRKTPDGYKTVEIQEIKSGKKDRAVSARQQSDNAREGLQEIQNGSNNVQLHRGKNDITGQFDRGNIAVDRDKALTVGPRGKDGFDQTSEYSTSDFDRLAKEILKQHGVTE